MNKLQKDKILGKIYFNLANAGSFGGLSNIWRVVRRKKASISKREVQDWLIAQDAYTIHKPFNSSTPGRKLITPGPNHLWQADLLDFQKTSAENEGIKYLLTIIDVFSKLAWVYPLKSKSAVEVLSAFKDLTKNLKPKYLQTDQGSEFFNKHMKQYLKESGIKIYATKSSKKASVIERFNRTLRQKLERYFTHVGNRKFVNVLDELVKGYNNSYHSSIKEKPINVSNANSRLIFKNLNGYYMDEGPEEEIKGFKFAANDKVRIVKYKTLFTKGTSPNWTREIFTINKVYPTLPPTYSLIDYNKENILGEFYENELQKIQKDDEIYQVENIIKSTGRKPNRKLFVKWLGYPDSFNSWINEKDYDI